MEPKVFTHCIERLLSVLRQQGNDVGVERVSRRIWYVPDTTNEHLQKACRMYSLLLQYTRHNLVQKDYLGALQKHLDALTKIE